MAVSIVFEDFFFVSFGFLGLALMSLAPLFSPLETAATQLRLLGIRHE